MPYRENRKKLFQCMMEVLKIFSFKTISIISNICPSLTSQSGILGFIDFQSEKFIIINHLLLIFKYCICKSRSNKHLNFLQLKTDMIKVKTLEKDLSNGDNNNSKKYRKKLQKISDILV